MLAVQFDARIRPDATFPRSTAGLVCYVGSKCVCIAIEFETEAQTIQALLTRMN
jgi:hypothetical protein